MSLRDILHSVFECATHTIQIPHKCQIHKPILQAQSQRKVSHPHCPQSLCLEQGHPNPMAASQSKMVAESGDTQQALPTSTCLLTLCQEGLDKH